MKLWKLDRAVNVVSKSHEHGLVAEMGCRQVQMRGNVNFKIGDSAAPWQV